MFNELGKILDPEQTWPPKAVWLGFMFANASVSGFSMESVRSFPEKKKVFHEINYFQKIDLWEKSIIWCVQSISVQS